ncbi:hypothetical protein CH063_04634 [Colletotrichum higginsianum]|uniref:Uncharacterized protein n=1 Tax=Colletotrichum higginsianum (strain IMI 349063) TaxID=759273 RepID=H1UW58_COLHI|nr:hypothetical protein CH063_04634 [Colletotrichum higginsianum]
MSRASSLAWRSAFGSTIAKAWRTPSGIVSMPFHGFEQSGTPISYTSFWNWPTGQLRRHD